VDSLDRDVMWDVMSPFERTRKLSGLVTGAHLVGSACAPRVAHEFLGACPWHWSLGRQQSPCSRARTPTDDVEGARLDNPAPDKLTAVVANVDNVLM